MQFVGGTEKVSWVLATLLVAYWTFPAFLRGCD